MPRQQFYLILKITKMKNSAVGVGKTPINTKLNFKLMSNPFKITKLNKVEAETLITSRGLKFKICKFYDDVLLQPIGDENTVYDFLNYCTDNKIFLHDKKIFLKPTI